nr:MAG TPA: hypothetical protein [Caudoviricetes sp.]
MVVIDILTSKSVPKTTESVPKTTENSRVYVINSK